MKPEPTSAALEKYESQPVAAPPVSNDPESLIRFAIERGSSPEAIERLMAVRRELQAEHAKLEFDTALAAFQAECPIIEKRKAVMEKSGGGVRYRYAPLDDIVAQVKQLLQKHGFSYTLNSPKEDNASFVGAVCTVTHRAGHSRDSMFRVPIDPKAFMSEAQKFASALTFSKRYAFCNAFGILTGDEDIDGAGARAKQAGPSAIHGEAAPSRADTENKRKLVDLLRSIHNCRGYALDDAGRDRITQWLIDENIIADDETVADLSGDKLTAVVAKVQNKLQPR
jgi:hypothetical protein